MRKNRANLIAEDELLQSLAAMHSSMQFQILFFDIRTIQITKPGTKPGLLPATSANLNLARRFIKGIQPEAGTDRAKALKQALALRPDVIFLLTDVDEPELSGQDLRELQRINGEKTVIHVVEFGEGADLSSDSFLKRLARQNHGKHYYRDVTKNRSSFLPGRKDERLVGP